MKNRTASPSAKTIALVIPSPGQASCNILAISDPLHPWQGGDCLPFPLLESHSYVDAKMCPIIRGGWMDKLMLKPWWAYRGWSTWLGESKGHLGRYTQLWCYFFHQILVCITRLTSTRQQSGGSVLLHASAHFGRIPMLSHFIDRSLIPM